MDKNLLEKPIDTNKISSNTTCNSVPVIEKADEHPEWLPDGWSVEVRTRKSGTHMGAVYKCYIEPVNGYKFYSKPEVLRYLEKINGNSCKSEKGKSSTPSNVAGEKSKADDLSPGWRKEVSATKNRNGVRKDPTAVEKSKAEDLPTERAKTVSVQKNGNDVAKDPVAVEKSKADDLTPGGTKEVSVKKNSNDSVTIEKCTADDLPPGWTKEIRIRKNDKGTRKDPYYIDPVTGYVFRSKKDVWRYVESGDINQCLFKPNKREIQEEDETAPSSTAKRQKVEQSATKQQLFLGKKAYEKSGMELSGANSSEKGHDAKASPAENPLEIIKTPDPAEKNNDLNMIDDADKNKHGSNSISKNKKGLNMPHRSSRRLSGIEPDQVTDSITNKQALQGPRRSLRNSITTSDVDSANKLSQQLNNDYSSPSLKVTGETGKNNAPEPDQVADSMTKKQARQGPRRSLRNSITTSDVDSENKSVQQLNNDYSSPSLKGAMNMTGETGINNAQDNKSTSQKDHRYPRRSSKRLAGSEPEITNSINFQKPLEYEGRKSKGGGVNAELPQSEGVPAKELANASTYIKSNAPRNEESSKRSKRSKITPRTNENEQLDDEKSEPQLSFAFHYSWSDPSVEFAIKTLTGVIPAADGSVDKASVLVPETNVVQENILSKSVIEGANDKVPQVTSNKSKVDVDSGPVLPETEVAQKIELSKVVTEGSSDKNLLDISKKSKDAVDNGHVFPEAEMVQKNKLSKKSPQITSKKSKNKKELSVPRRLSKRLAGHEPEVAPAEIALEYATRKSGKDVEAVSAILGNEVSKDLNVGDDIKLVPQASDCSNAVFEDSSSKGEKSHETQILPSEQLQGVEAEKINLTLQASTDCSERRVHEELSNETENLHEAQIFPNEELQKVEAEKTELTFQASDCSERRVHGELSNKAEKSHEAQIIPDEQLQKVEAEKPEKSEPQLSGPFGDSWSDPCFEFAIKTLTGAYPADATADDLPVMSPGVNGPPNKGLLENAVEKCVYEEAHFNLNDSQYTEDIDKVFQPSEQLLDQPELRTSSTSYEDAPKFGSRESCGDQSNITLNLNEGEPQDIFEAADMISQPSKQFLGQPELRTSSTSFEISPKFAARDSYFDEVNIPRNLYGGSIDMADQSSKQFLGQHELRTSSTPFERTPTFTTGKSFFGNEASSERAPTFTTGKSFGNEARESLHIGSIDMAGQSSKQFLGQHELRTSSTACERTPTFTTGKSFGNEASCGRTPTFTTGKSFGNEPRESLHIGSIDMAGQSSKQFLGQHDLRTSSMSCERTPTFMTGKSFGNEARESLHIGSIDMAGHSSKQFLGQHELRTSSTSCERTPTFTTGKSFGNEASCERAPTFMTGKSFGNEARESLHTGSIDMAGQSSKQFFGQHELRTSSTSCERTPTFTTGNFFGNEARESLRIDFQNFQNKSPFVNQFRTADALTPGDPSHKFGIVHQEQSAPAGKPQLETQTKSLEKSGSLFSAPLVDSWSDPCFEFAYKTLTGTLPMEENVPMQGVFPEPANFRSPRHANFMFPDFGSPSFPQSDISFHTNVDKSTQGQQSSSMSSSVLPPEKVSLNLFVDSDSDKHYSQSSKNFQGR